MYEVYERLCRERGVTSADVSRATGIGQSTLGNWKARRSNLSLKYLKKIAEYFGVSIEYLTTGQQSLEEVEAALSPTPQTDYLITDNDDVAFIVNSIRKWTPTQQKRLRKQVEWVNSIIGEE